VPTKGYERGFTMNRKNNNTVTIEEQAEIDAINDVLEDIGDQEVIEFPIYQIDDKFTADDLFDTKGKQKMYASPEFASRAQETGKYGVRQEREVSAKPKGAPRKSGVAVAELTLPEDFDSKSKAWRARFLVDSGVSMGDTARFMNVRFQQVYQAVSYGKKNTED
jgi:hypothetical protein